MSNAEHTAKCLHCGRVRRFRTAEAASAAKPYGRICGMRVRLAATAEAVKDFAATTIDKARELIADGGLIPTTREGVFRAVSSKGDGTTVTLSMSARLAILATDHRTPPWSYHPTVAEINDLCESARLALAA